MHLAELVQRTGCPASTIHYYRRLGLLPAPLRGPGRVARYDERHALRLSRIAELRRAGGLSLRQIADALPPQTPSSTPSVDTRARLAAAAAEVFIDHGLDGLTMDALAAAMAVGKPTLYRHFDGRDALLCACLQGGHVAVPACTDGGMHEGTRGGMHAAMHTGTRDGMVDRIDAAADAPPAAWLRARLACARIHAQRLRGVDRLCLALWDHEDRQLSRAARAAHGAMIDDFCSTGLHRFERARLLPPGDTGARARALFFAVRALTDDGAALEGAAMRAWSDSWCPRLWALLGGRPRAAPAAPDAPPGAMAQRRYGWGAP